mgnify:CR=1 FL=1
MCDYSVVAKNQRDYRTGERLVVTQFGPYTRGTASPDDRTNAVCLRSGACLMISDLPKEIRESFELSKGELYPIFMQLPNRERNHRDALVFDNGRTILVSKLPIGLAMTVHERRPDITVGAALPELVAVLSR